MVRISLFLLSFLFILGCATDRAISPDLRAKMGSSITFKEVAQNPDTYKGKMVIWGGEIIQTLPQDDGTILVEVLEWPLGWRGKPKRTVEFHGKFLVFSKEPLDLSLYKRGTEITVAGEIEGSMPGEKVKSVGDSTYRYPLLLSKEIHLWKGRSYSYSSLPYYRGASEYRYGGILRY